MSASNNDRRVVLGIVGAIVLLVTLTAIFAPATQDDDPQPSTYNSGARGWKGAYLLLQQLGYRVSRSDQSTASTLEYADAPHTVYLLADPYAPGEEVQKREYDAVERFLQRGGRVIATGFRGAYFLPGGRTGKPSQFVGELCTTVPEGKSILAQAGNVSMYDAAPWNAREPLVRVDARCGADAVVVHRDYPHGGRMVFLSSSEPFSNRGLKQDNALHLLLLSVGAGERAVIFDECYHGTQTSPSDYLKGLPLRSLIVQVALVLLLLMFTYTRRSGPIREPLRVPRSSPIEFAYSMGALYERARTSQPATEAARRRLISFLIQACGVTTEMVYGPADTLASAVGSRFGVDAAPLERVLERASAARYETLRPRDALALVRAIDAEIERLRMAMTNGQQESLTVEIK